MSDAARRRWSPGLIGLALLAGAEARADEAPTAAPSGPATAPTTPTAPADPRAAFGLGRGAPAKAPTPAGDARDVFGLGRKDDAPATCATARDLPCPFAAELPPAVTRTVLARARIDRLPVADGDLDTVAALAVGGGRDDSGAVYGGATGLENRWTVDGAPIDSPRTGGLDVRVPLAFVEQVTITTGGFSARDPASTGAVIEATLVEGGDRHRARATVWAGGAAAARELPIARGELRLFEATWGELRELSAAAVVDGPLPRLAGARTWYAAGVAPIVVGQALRRRSYRLTDDDGDGAVDVAASRYVRTPLHPTDERASWSWSTPVMLRLGAERGAHQLTLTGLASYTGDTRWLPTAEASAAGVDRRTVRLDGIARWQGRWDRLAATVTAAWHRAHTDERPRDPAGDAPAHGYAYVPAPVDGLDATDAAVRAGCVDGGDDDVAPMIVNCPLPTGYYWTGGVGRLFDLASDRPSVTAELEHQLGEHLLMAGVTGDDGQLVRGERYSGGSYRQQLADGIFLDYEQVEIGQGPDYPTSCGDSLTCRVVLRTERVYRTRHVAAWLVDRWQPAPTVSVELGARLDHNQLGTALVLREVLPRAGLAWDFLGDGRSRAFVGWGRYTAPLVTGTGERLFAGPTVRQTATFGDQTSVGVTSAPIGTTVVAGTRGVRVDEVTGGVEAGVADLARLALAARHRHLGRALDDDLLGLGNPGRDPDGGPAATRDASEVTVALETSARAATSVRIGYAWSRLVGNWPGPWDPVDGVSLYLSSAFDDGSAYGATVPLPGDQPHRFFAELAARGHLAGFAVDGGLRASAASGRPRNARAERGEQQFLLPRGATGRLPTVSQANLHLGARRGRL